MTKMKDAVVFRDDLYFEGAVQADWFYQKEQVEAVASSFVFHGPQNHAVSKSEVGGHGLMDTASFALRLAQKMEHPDEASSLTLAIAGYGTGKSHLAVTLASLFSGEDWMPELHEAILANVARADATIEQTIRPLVRKPRLVLTVNGMKDFNLHYEILRTAEKALKMYGSNLNVLTKLNKVKETASVFIERSFDLLEAKFTVSAQSRAINISGGELKQFLLSSLNEQQGVPFDIINEVYTEFNGHPIRLDEGVSAGAVLDVLVQECCGLHGQFDGVVILFDEFGRFLEYVSSQPAAAGDSALQQIFESVQNASGDIQFVGFIQSDIKSYLQRVDKSSNISRYIDRYDASEKVYLSSNLETIFANLLDKQPLFAETIGRRLSSEENTYQQLFSNLQKWLPVHGIWNSWSDFRRIIVEAIYPLHPISTYLLCNLTDWLQSRSSLNLLSGKIREMRDIEITEERSIPLIYPVDLLKGAFFEELLNAEEQGRQRSQFCILLNSIYRKFDTKLTEESRNVLLANLILRICRFRFDNLEELIEAIKICSNCDETQVESAIQLLEDEYAVLSYDDRLVCFDFVADSVGANEFRNFLRAAQNRMAFRADFLAQNDILEFADMLKSIDTDFGSKHGIQTREWAFVQRIEHIQNVTTTTFDACYKGLVSHTLPNTERGLLLWVYLPKEVSSEKVEELAKMVSAYEPTQAVVVAAIDDADNSLQDAIVSYKVLADMREDDKAHYQRFYADALEKAKEKVSLLFADRKQERKIVTSTGIVPADKRLKTYLTSVFEMIYPKAMPFDFEGFDTKTASGSAYKNFCTIMKWIMMDHMSYTALKSQSTEVRNRIDSLLGPVGIYSWKALSSDYKGIAPVSITVSQLYSKLESVLNTKKIIPFKQIATKLTAAPYGMNEYAAFMLLVLFSENYAYTSRLEMDGTRYSTESWAEAVLQDKKYDIKLFGKTKLILIDVGETIGRYRTLYTKIKKNTDFSKVPTLTELLNKLKNEEAVPDALQAEDDLALMLLGEGEKARRYYTDQMDKLYTDFEHAEKNLNPYSALMTAYDVQKLSLETYASGRYLYSAEQTQEMNTLSERCKRIAEKAFADGWIQRHRCNGVEKLGSFKNFTGKASDLFIRFGYVDEASALNAKAEKEIARVQLIVEQEALINGSEQFLISSQIRKGLTQKNLASFADQGNDYIEQFQKFDYSSDKHLAELYEGICVRVSELNSALDAFKKELDGIWNAIYDLMSVDDVKHIQGRIEAVLGSGLTDKDRDDLENIDRDISDFLAQVAKIQASSCSRSELKEACDRIKASFAEAELDVTPAIDSLYNELLDQMDNLEKEWVSRYLAVVPSNMTQPELDQWKRVTQPLPEYIRAETEIKHQRLLEAVERELSKQRIDYILMLFECLTDDEKSQCYKALTSNSKS